MPQFVAFLRAVNVGGRTVKMERLRELFGALGYTRVRTFIASGNVLFEARRASRERLEREVEQSMREAFGFEVATCVRTAEEVIAAAAESPFPVDGVNAGAALYIGFCKQEPTAANTKTVEVLRSATDEFEICGRELYWLCRTKISDSPVTGAILEKKLGVAMTLRNATTVRKIAELCASADGDRA